MWFLTDGNYVKIGYFDTQTDNLTILNQEKWTGKFVSWYLCHVALQGLTFIVKLAVVATLLKCASPNPVPLHIQSVSV